MRDAMIFIMVVWLGACCSLGACLAGCHILATRAGLLHLPQLSVSTHGLPDTAAKQRRALLAAQHSTASSTSTLHSNHMHPAWALLATHSNYLFSFEGMSYAAQQQTLAAIQAHGAVVTSVMPPHTWVVAASLKTAEWLAQLPSTALVPYPKFLKLAPEWVSVTTNMHMDGLAAQLHAAMQHDSMSACGEEPTPNTAAHTAWAACRSERGHMGTTFANGTAQPRVAGAGSKPSNSQQAIQPKFLIEVQFPALAREDMRRLGLTPIPSWRDGLQHMSHSMSAAGAKAGYRGRYANGTFLPAVAAALDWQGPIQAAAPACGADLIMEHGTLLVAACAQDLMSVLSWLAQQPSVRWLAPRMQLQLHNLAASTISQSGGMNDITDLKNDALRPFWQAGIDGTGQILGIGDSGLDMDNCYFFDQANIVSRSSFTDSNGNLVYDNPGHRKVILYYSMYDNVIDPGGHGTHTSGTLAGAAWGEDPLHSPSRATGMAPGAKLAFLSLSSPSDAPGSTLVHTPGDLRDSYYPRSYIKGARIHSDSWGNTNTNYDSMCSSADMFAYENQDFLPIFSAGNYGDDVSGANYKATITSPALAKNVMGIGATHSFDSAAPPAGGEPTLMMTITISTSAKPLVVTALMVKARAGGSWDSLKGSPLPLAAASTVTGEDDACSALSNTASVSGRIVIAVRSTKCNYGTQLNTIAAAGGRGLILTNKALDGYFYLPDLGSDLSGLPPAGGVPMGVGRILWDAANSPLGATITFSDRATQGARYDQLATFSSFGPTLDGRIKPDLVATGFLWSANSDNLLTGATTCVADSLQRQGTSMAAPAVAGSAALVRQYFTDGFYPSGAKSPDNKPWNPSGPLIRAVLMAGAASMLGNVERGNPTAGGLPMERPSMRQGWGRMDLSGSLPLTTSTANKGWSIQVVDQATLVQDGRHRYCVNALDGPLRIMLVWHDYPGDVMASKTLVNNLDLEVRADGLGSKLLMGNVYGTNYLNSENQQQTGDDVNNVESVFLENVPSGLVVINVVGRSISAKTTNQSYALVVLGRFSGTMASAQNPAYTASSANLCPDINALVDPVLSPEPPGRVSPSRDQTFHLTTTTGQPLEQGKTFECQLSDLTGNTTGGPLHPWRQCSEPVTYTGLPDGTYVFKVRVSGSNFPDSRTLTIDATAPVTTLTSTLDSANGAPTAAQTVTFGVTAQDASNVTFTCFLQLTNPTPGGPALMAKSLTSDSPGFPPLTVCTDSSCSGSPCNSPITLWGLSYGDWMLRVQARDAVGNVEQPGPIKSWKIRYTPGATYTRLEQAPATPRKDAQVTVNLFAFTGSSSGDASLLPSTSTFEYRVFQASSGGTGNWTATGPALTATLPSDGEWTVQARVTGNANPPADTVAEVTVVLDTTAPVMVITEQPTAMVGLKEGGQFLATIKFTTTKNESVTYQCRWLTSTTAKVPEDFPEGTGLTAFSEANCNGIRPGTASQPVDSGFWLFQVRANDTVGNLGAPASVSFLVDTQPPAITNLQYPAYSQDRGVNITYDVADLGLSGLAAGNITCSMTPTYLSPTISPRLGPQPPPMYLNVSGLPETPCRNPAMYALVEGKYQFTLTAADNAGLTTTVSALIVLDLQPPITKITNAPARGAFPKNHVIQFAAVDQPVGGASGVNRTVCTLLWKSASITGTLSPPPPAPPQPPPSGNAPAPPPGNRTLNGRRLTADDPGPAPTTPLAKVNGADILHNTPFTCTSPLNLMGLATATYELQAYSVDNAGNDGRPSLVASYSFLIDASLADDGSNTTSPDPGSSGGGGFASNTLAIALTIALSVAAAIAIVVGVCVARSRAARRRELQYQQDQQRLQQQQPPDGEYNNMWYGYPQPAARGVPAGQNGQSFHPVVQSADARRQWEEDKVRLAIQASVEEENMRKAIELSRQDQYSKMEEQRIQAAIKASLEASGARR